MRRLALLFLIAATAFAANFRLYLKDGGFHLVREYKVDGDSVRFYSIERSEWEEMPTALIDLKKTENERATKQATIDRQAKAAAEEDNAARQARDEIQKIPVDPGMYRIEDGKLRIFTEPETTVHSEKAMNTLKRLSPTQNSSYNSTLEMKGEHSENVLREDRPEFYVQMASQESLALVVATPGKGVRVLEHVSVDQMTKETTEERKTIPIFQKQLTEGGLYRIWPQQPLPKGDYAVMEFTEGKMNQRAWDFRID